MASALVTLAEVGIVIGPSVAFAALPYTGVVDQQNAWQWVAVGLAWFLVSAVAIILIRRRSEQRQKDAGRPDSSTLHAGRDAIGNVNVQGSPGATVHNYVNAKPDKLIPITILAMGDSETATFYTTSAYKPGSLTGYVDGQPQEAKEEDPAHGGFSFPFIPKRGEHIMASWTVDADADPLDQWRNAKIAEGDGQQRTFRTLTPYEPATLSVTVDGQRIESGLQETDPTTGAFAIDFAPLPQRGDSRPEMVRARWKVAGTPWTKP